MYVKENRRRQLLHEINSKMASKKQLHRENIQKHFGMFYVLYNYRHYNQHIL